MKNPDKTSSYEIIDIHSHLYPECYLRALETRQTAPRVTRVGGERVFAIFPEEAGSGGGRPMTAAFWDLDEKMATMDRSGIDRSVVSLGNPWLNPMPTAEGDALARQINIELSMYCEQTGGRLAAMGALPAGSVGAAVAELGFIAAARGLVGVSAGPAIAGLELDDRGLDPFWEGLERLDLPLFIHPENGLSGRAMQGYGLALPLGVAFPFETTLVAARLVLGGVLERHQGLRILLAHGGGALPYLAGRLDAMWRAGQSLRESLPRPPSEYIRQFYFDGLVYSAPAMQALAELAGPGRILFGSDHPFDVADPAANLQAVRAVFEGRADQAQVLGGNARDFFGI